MKVIKYDKGFDIDADKRYSPILTVINKKIYVTTNWNNLFKILLFTYCCKNNNMDQIEKDCKLLGRSGDFAFCDDIDEETIRFVKFSPKHYVMIYRDNRDIDTLKDIERYTGRANLEIYIAEYSLDETDKLESFKNDAVESFKNTSKQKVGNTHNLVTRINNAVLSDKEKFIIKINTEFDKVNLLGDISIDENEEKILKEYMHDAIELILQGYAIKNKKVFAYGLVWVAQRRYMSKTFWPYVNEEFGVHISGNDQYRFRESYESVMKRKVKHYDEEVGRDIQNICMHAFVCNPCTDQFFKYLFDFWRIDIARNIENSVDEDGKDMFDMLIEEISEHPQNIMLHTALALKNNPKGSKIRIRRLLNLIDHCYWNDVTPQNSKSRLVNRFMQWKDNPHSAFHKEWSKTEIERNRGRGERLLTSPTIEYDPRTYSFSLILPKQLLRGCQEEEEPVWIISFNDIVKQIPADLLRGNVFLYTNECSIPLDRNCLFNRISIVIKSDRREYKEFVIEQDDIRFFNGRRRLIKYGDYISRDAASFFVKKGYSIEFINGDVTGADTSSDCFDFYTLGNLDGVIMVLPNGHALPFGRPIEEGLISSRILTGVKAVDNDEFYSISSTTERVFFKTTKSFLKGTSIKVYKDSDLVYFGKVIDKKYIEFKVDDVVSDIYGYIIDLREYMTVNGLYKIEIGIPRCNLRVYRICYIEGFNYEYMGAPFVFKDYGSILVPDDLGFEFDGKWISLSGYRRFNFSIDENETNDYVKEHKLHLNYKLPTASVMLEFDIPALYWKYEIGSEWLYQRPSDMFAVDLPDKIYVSGNVDLSSTIMCIEGEDVEIRPQYDKESDSYYFRTVDLSDYLDREDLYRDVLLKIDDEYSSFLKVYCRSVLNSYSISGNTIDNKIYGSFDIYGRSEYAVTIKRGNEVVAELEPLDNGKLDFECEVEEGSYTIELYELETDSSGFGSIPYLMNSLVCEVNDPTKLDKASIKILHIKNRDHEIANTRLNKTMYFIMNLSRTEYDPGIMTWLDVDDDFWLRCVYYIGDFCSGNEKEFIARAMVIFDDFSNINEVMIKTEIDGEYLDLVYDSEKECLIGQDVSFNQSTKCLNDDKYKFGINIRRRKKG